MFKPSNNQPGKALKCSRGSSHELHSFLTMNSPDCDGGLVDIYSTCYSSNFTDCSSLPGQRCKSHPTGKIRYDSNKRWLNDHATVFVPLGVFCPSSYPHAYNGGKDCCSSPWRDLVPGNSTCDGDILQEADSCCPAGKGISCNKDSSYTCKTNPKYGKYQRQSMLEI